MFGSGILRPIEEERNSVSRGENLVYSAETASCIHGANVTAKESDLTNSIC